MLRVELRVTRPETLDPARASDITNQEIERGLGELVMEFERRVRLNTPVGVLGDSGGLRGSIYGELRGKPVRSGIVGHSTVYGDVVELGRRPGSAFPPVAPIEFWVRKKLGVPAEQARAVAFLVARKIARRGYPGAHMFERAFEEGRGVIETVWGRMGERLAERLG